MSFDERETASGPESMSRCDLGALATEGAPVSKRNTRTKKDPFSTLSGTSIFKTEEVPSDVALSNSWEA